MRRTALSLILPVVASAAVVAAPTAAQAAPTVSPIDRNFLVSNATTDLAEITIGTIALQRSQTPVVRRVALVTIADHEVALAKVTDVAQQVGVTLPDAPTPGEQAAAAKLATVAADKFDHLYLHVQKNGHLKSIKITKGEIRAGSNPTVVSFAKYYLPVAVMHLKMTLHAMRVLASA